MIDDADAVGHTVGFVHVVRGEEHGHALGLVDLLHMRPELVAALGIEAQRGLVEEENARRMQKAARDLQPPLHAAGEFFDLVVAAFPEFEELEQLFGALAADFVRDVIEDAVHLHVLPGGQVAVEAGVLEDDAEAPARFVLLALRIEAVQFDGAAGGLQQRGEHFDGGGFPGAVGAEEGEDLPSSTSKETSLTAVKEPKVFTRFRTWIIEVDLPTRKQSVRCVNRICQEGAG